MRDKEFFREQMQKSRYNKKLQIVLANRITCFYCTKPAQTLHHINENQRDNSLRNLLPVCHEHHLNIPHDCDLSPAMRLKPFPQPQKAVNSTKCTDLYLNSTVNTKINDTTIRNPKACVKIIIDSISQRAFKVLVDLGYTEVIN
jgi:hypothetical protein